MKIIEQKVNENKSQGSIRIGTALKSNNGISKVKDIYISTITKHCIIKLENGDKFTLDNLMNYIDDGDILVENSVIKTESLSQIEKDLKDILGFKRGFKDHNSLNKFMNSRGYEVIDYDTDYGNHYIDIVGIGDKYDGYRYSFDFDDMSDLPDGRLAIGKFMDKDSEEVKTENKDSDEYDEIYNGHKYKYINNIKGYWIYRAVINGKGVWRAMHQDDSNFSKSSFSITYDQARGFEPIA